MGNRKDSDKAINQPIHKRLKNLESIRTECSLVLGYINQLPTFSPTHHSITHLKELRKTIHSLEANMAVIQETVMENKDILSMVKETRSKISEMGINDMPIEELERVVAQQAAIFAVLLRYYSNAVGLRINSMVREYRETKVAVPKKPEKEKKPAKTGLRAKRKKDLTEREKLILKVCELTDLSESDAMRMSDSEIKEYFKRAMLGE